MNLPERTGAVSVGVGKASESDMSGQLVGGGLSVRSAVGLVNTAMGGPVGAYLVTASMGVAVTVAVVATVLVGWVLHLYR